MSAPKKQRILGAGEEEKKKNIILYFVTVDAYVLENVVHLYPRIKQTK